MKKIFATLALSLFAVSTMAWELGVSGGRDFSGADRNYAGISLSHDVGPVGVTAGYSRTFSGDDNQNRFSVMAGVDLVKLGPVTVTPVVGVAYLHNQASANGLALAAGVSTSLPIRDRMDLVVDWTHQWGQERVNTSNGNRVSAGIRYAF